jgi:hypothetical protein
MDFFVVAEQTCPDCEGGGSIACRSAVFDRICLRCNGSGRLRREVPLLVALAELGLGPAPDDPGQDLGAFAQSMARFKAYRQGTCAPDKEGGR